METSILEISILEIEGLETYSLEWPFSATVKLSTVFNVNFDGFTYACTNKFKQNFASYCQSKKNSLIAIHIYVNIKCMHSLSII